MTLPAISYKRHRFPPQIIAHAVWLYFRLPLSLRLVEEMLFERGILVSYETVRRWARKFGPDYARRLKRKRPSRCDIWHLDEVAVTIAGQKHWLWRAVDQDGYVLDEIVETRRDTRAAKRLLTRLLRKQGVAPKRIITDKLPSYGAARRQIMPKVDHRSHKGLNNRAENSHVPLRKHEQMMRGWICCKFGFFLSFATELRRLVTRKSTTYGDNQSARMDPEMAILEVCNRSCAGSVAGTACCSNREGQAKSVS
ncbi:IS6 family transposase [Microvirga lotononidis]|uniref:Transposase n=1 Tax=Microvirga lotononidis TaxID=864069 RepID=I4Z4W6_9HYPH|nr:transposase [Microvirga lotononidis]